MTFKTTMLFVSFLLFLSISSSFKRFIAPSYHRDTGKVWAENSFDGGAFEKDLKSMGPVWSNTMNKEDEITLGNIRNEQIAREEIYRKYPFEETKLPVLPDCNNYYSGKFGDYFWHQNADQVFVYIPVNDDVVKKDISVQFEAKYVKVMINGEDEISFECLERIIPDGSFWVMEEDKEGKRYVQLDLEKRFRMINWKGLFGEADKNDVNDIEKRSDMLEKLFSANKGMSRLTGSDPESIGDMMDNEDLVKMLGRKLYPDPQVVGIDSDEEYDKNDIDLEEIQELVSKEILDVEIIRENDTTE